MTLSQKGDRTLIKHMNRQLVLQLIQARGPISRRDISQMSGLSAASVSGITSGLIEQDLVHEVGEAEGAGRAGRRAVLLRLNPKAGYVVGVKLAVHTISCVLTDLDARVLHYTESAMAAGAPADPEITIQAAIRAIEELLKQTSIQTDRLLGIGVGVNGTVDAAKGVSLMAPHFGWRDVALAEPIARRFGIPVYLENDARTLTIAEQWFGAGREVEHFVTVVVGHGIGAGVVANGQLYSGAASGAGEFGHIPLTDGGPPCSCGRRGCVESYASVPAIFRQIQEALAAGRSSSLAGEDPLTLTAIADAAERGDAVAVEVLDRAGRWLGLGMVSLINILNPDLVVINGEAACLGRSYFGPMETTLRQRAFAGLADSFRILFEPGGNEMWARGAACVVLSSLFVSVEDMEHTRTALADRQAISVGNPFRNQGGHNAIV